MKILYGKLEEILEVLYVNGNFSSTTFELSNDQGRLQVEFFGPIPREYVGQGISLLETEAEHKYHLKIEQVLTVGKLTSYGGGNYNLVGKSPSPKVPEFIIAIKWPLLNIQKSNNHKNLV